MDDFNEMYEATPFADVVRGLCTPGRDENSIKTAAVTSALVEVIQEKLGANSFDDVKPPALFASALNALSSTNSSDSTDSSSSPQLSLMEVILQVVPYVSTSNPNLYVHQFTTLSRALRGVVASIPSSTGQDQSRISIGWNSLLRQCIRTASTAINGIVVINNATKMEKEVLKCFHATILQHFDDPRAKVRRQAHACALELLQVSKSLQGDGMCSLIPSHMVEYTQQILSAFLKQDSKGKKKENDFSKKEKIAGLLHLLSFLESALPLIETRGRLALAKDLMRLFEHSIGTDMDDSHNNVMVANGILSVLLQIFDSTNREVIYAEENTGDEDAFCAQALAMLLQSNAKFINCTNNSNEGVGSCRTYYARCIVAASLRMLSENNNEAQKEVMKRLVPKLLPLSITATVSCVGDDSSVDEAVQSICAELGRLIRSQQMQLLIGNEAADEEDCIETCIASMQKVLHFRFRTNWFGLMPCLASLATALVQGMIPSSGANEVVMSKMMTRVKPLVCGLVQLHVDVDDKASKQVIENAVGGVVEGIGIEFFLEIVDLGVSTKGSNTVPGAVSNERAWILDVIKSSLPRGSSPYRPRLAFFQSHVLELARKCDAASAADNITALEASIQKSRVVDLWSLFPSFCVNTSDIELTFPSLAQTLVRAMSDKRYPQLMSILCTGLTKLAIDVKSRMDNPSDNNDQIDSDARILSECSIKILPSLFKLVESLHGVGQKQESRDPSEEMEEDDDEEKKKSSSDIHRVVSVTDSISAFALFAPEEFRKGLFKKIIQRLLVATQSEQDETEKMCTLLGLAGALVKSGTLNEESISLLYRAIKPLIRSDEHNARVQKKSYKVFADICQDYNDFVIAPERLKEILDLLVGSTMSLQVSARYMRLKCIQYVVEGFDSENPDQMKIIPNIVGEVLLCLKDANHKTRESAYQLLISMARIRNDMTAYFHIVVGALGAQTSHMRSAAVMALSRLVFEFAREDFTVQSLLPHVLQTVIVLFDENSREVTKSVVGFVRVSAAALNKDQLEPLLPDVVGGMMKYNRGRGRFRQKIKIILKRLVRTFGYEKITALVPETDTRLLTHMRKLSERAARRKAANIQDGQTAIGDFDNMMESDEEDSDDGRTFMTGVTGFTKHTAGTRKSEKSMTGDGKSIKSTSKSMLSSKSTSTMGPRLDTSGEKSGDILDMLDSNVNKKVHFAQGDENDFSDDDDDEAMEFDGSGKLVVVGDDRINFSSNNNDEDDEAEHVGKKQRVSKFESAKTVRDNLNVQKSKKKQQDKRDNKTLGAAYKSTKAGGDVRRKNQYEPYCFVPLEGRNFSKKNRGKSVEQMSSVVRQGGKRKRN
jgi:ribosomal RNA-processing protein 12